MVIIRPEGLKKITAAASVPGCVCSIAPGYNRDTAKDVGGGIGSCQAICAFGWNNFDANYNQAYWHEAT